MAGLDNLIGILNNVMESMVGIIIIIGSISAMIEMGRLFTRSDFQGVFRVFFSSLLAMAVILFFPQAITIVKQLIR